MADKSKIEWLNGGSTVNPIRARLKELYTGTVANPLPAPIPKGKIGWMCVKVSPGCEGCYAEKQNVICGTNPGRNGTGLKYAADKLPLVELFLDGKTLLQPLHWKKGRLIFLCSMTDWMADFVPDEWRDKMLAVMALTPQHTYLTLTKRADRQQKYFAANDYAKRLWDQMVRIDCEHHLAESHPGYAALRSPEIVDSPLPNNWRGVSVENQEYADSRIPLLLQTPAAVRWISAEPLLSQVEIVVYLSKEMRGGLRQEMPGIDWLVAGGESGHNARPMHPDWARSLRDQCRAARVPFFFKQWGEYLQCDKPQEAFDPKTGNFETVPAAMAFKKVGKKAAGRLLDGKEHSEYPERGASQ